ncbi:hypothetical protein OAC73_03705 [Flavobacteriaceae bacterium]|nr:hypothetical protein [Flavobacteriaceae bacterium]
MGLFRFNIQSKELTKVIDSEFNRLALYQKNDSLFIGGVDVLIKYPIKDFINYKPLKFNSSFDDTYLIIIFLCLVIVMLLILKFNKKTIIIEGAAPSIENQINGFISNNISNASVIGIQKEFNISYRQLSKIYEPIGPGKKIELYELWLSKIEELFGAQNSDLYVGGSSDFAYHDQLKRLEGILKIDRTKISKDPFWIEKS